MKKTGLITAIVVSFFAQISLAVTSPTRSVDIYEDGTNTSDGFIRILYALDSVVGDDGLTYRPVDMGAGLAWANKNVGAADTLAPGSYFYWGGTSAITSVSTSQYYTSLSGITSTTAQTGDQYPLPAEADAATQVMGTKWRMPTAKEMNDLITTTSFSSTGTSYNYFITNKYFDDQSIFMPTTGRIESGSTIASRSSLYLLTSVRHNTASKAYQTKAWHLYNQKIYGNNNTAPYYAYLYFGEAVRAVYVPPFELCTLTVETYTDETLQATYTYLCEKGQRVSLTANEADGSIFSAWATETVDGEQVSDEPIQTFTVDEDRTLCALFVTGETGRVIETAISPYHSGTVRGGGTFRKLKTIILTATPAEHYSFHRWSDGMTENPRSVTIRENATFTAEFVLDDITPTSEAVAVEVFQSGKREGTAIKYALPSLTTGDDGKTYTPVDLGSGVAWADKNVGADETTDKGWFFYWGGTDAITDKVYNTVYYDGVFPMPTTPQYDSKQYALPLSADVARDSMGSSWRMPTLSEIYYMTQAAPGEADGDGGYLHTNAIDTAKHIYIPNGGYKKTTGKATITTGAILLGSTTNAINAASTQPAYYLNGSYSAGASGYLAWHAMPVRGVYVPPFETCSLTINIGTHTYHYVCEYGQRVTVTAYATEEGNAFTNWTNEDGEVVSEHITETFTVLGNTIYTANIESAPEDTYRLTTLSQPVTGGDIQGGGTIGSGKTAVLTATPREGYTFTRWADGSETNPRSVVMNEDKTMTAIFTVDPALENDVTATAMLYQDGTGAGYTIKYPMESTVVNPGTDDEITYHPVDVGAGVAWADKNVDAADSTDAGSYFYWGSIEPMETYNVSQANPFIANPGTLPAENDAATQRIGSHWRTPTKDEWSDLIAHSDRKGLTAYMFSNPNEPDKRIFLPNTGWMNSGTTVANPLVNYYWSSTINTWSATLKSLKAFYYTGTAATNAQIGTYGMPVRAVYQPDFEVVTLTINVYSGDYQQDQTLQGTYYYPCRKGQHLTLTAYSTDTDYPLLKWTNTEDQTVAVNPVVDFLVTEDATYNLYFDSGSVLETNVITTSVTPTACGEVTGGGVYQTGSTTQLLATPTGHYVFTGWSDGVDDNPRTITVTEDKTYTAEFAYDNTVATSPTATAEVFQSGRDEGTVIKYAMESTTVGGITYTPVDLGVGLAWADRNIGAETFEDGGSYFYWGGTEAVTRAYSTAAEGTYYAGVTSMVATTSATAVQHPLPASADAATQIMGRKWRIPTSLEVNDLISSATGKGSSNAAAAGYTYYNLLDEDKSIYLPPAGYYTNATCTLSHTFFWASTVRSINPNAYQSFSYRFYDGAIAAPDKFYEYYAMPVRAVYQPPFEVCTVTVNVATDGVVNATYVYMCELGQSLTLTAYATEYGNSFINWTNEYDEVVSGDITHTFHITGNATYTANISTEPENTVVLTTHVSPLTGGLVRGDGIFVNGKTAVLTAEPDEDYTFTRWADGVTVNPRSVTVTQDTVLTAVFTIKPSAIAAVQSAAATANVYQDGTEKGIFTIKYLMKPDTVNKGTENQIIYNPVDVGSGVAWADKNVDAKDSTQAGSYFYWGSIEPMETYNVSQANPFSANPGTLPAENDAATQRIGSHWRTPTRAEWNNLFSYGSRSGATAYTVSNYYNPDYSIFLPNTGWMNSGTTVASPLVNYYWSSTINTYKTALKDLKAYYYTATAANNAQIGTYGLPVRAVYQPDFELITITVNAYENETLTGTYNYICEYGQYLTITAYSTDNDYPLYRWTNADGQTIESNPIVTLYATEDAMFNVYFSSEAELNTRLITTSVTPTACGEVTGGGVYPAGSTTRLLATPTGHYVFTGWSDGVDDNPRTITVTEDKTYTAEFAYDNTAATSPTATAEVFQSGKDEGTVIKYRMESTTIDEITYTPVDLGSGIAWANKNIGAADSTVIGTYFFWGDIEGSSSFTTSQYYIGYTAMVAGDNLPASADAATQIMGSKWRMPTIADWTNLAGNATIKRASASPFNATVTNKISENSVLLPAGGYYSNANALTTSTYCYYWSDELKAYNATPSSATAKYWRNTDKTVSDAAQALSISSGMPIRAVYQPPFEVCTVTVNVATDGEVNATYVYMCELGQNLTLTAYATEDGNAFVNWTNEYDEVVSADITHTFHIKGDVTYTANITSEPEDVVTLTLVSQPFTGGVIQRGSNTFVKGKTAVLTVTPAPDYTFTGWSDGNNDNPRSVVMTHDTVLTATYRLDITPTNSRYAAEVFQSGSNKGYYISYALPDSADGYDIVDIGAGIGWADRNVGADEPSEKGNYYFWGGTTAMGNYNASQTYPGGSFAAGTVLPTDYDVATQTMGENWRMPTWDEWKIVINNSSWTGSAAPYTVTNPNNVEQSIILPATGNKQTDGKATLKNPANSYFWTSTAQSASTAYYVGNKATNNCNFRFGMAVRGVYEPDFDGGIADLTIIVRTDEDTNTDKVYHYMCERGQQVRVTAYATEDGNAFLNWTNENGEIISDSITKTFIVTGDSTYMANISSTPENTVTLDVISSPFAGGVIQRGSNTFIQGKTAVLTVFPAENYTFTGWSDGNSDNPRSVVMTQDTVLTATYSLDVTPSSSAVSVEVFQSGYKEGTVIEHKLESQTVGGITYTPVDLGTGIGWADKNVLAEESTDAGGYFYWGGTEPMETYDAAQANPFTENPGTLPAENDAATKNMSDNWRTPTKAEWQNLLSRATWTGTSSYVVSNANDEDQQIFLPNTGYMRTAGASTVTSGTANYYWSATIGTWNVTLSKCTVNYYTATKVAAMTNAATGLPVRAVYVPPFETCSLTVNVATDGVVNATYVYVGELGQQITVTAYATEDGNAFTNWTNTNDEVVSETITQTFLLTGDSTYTANITTEPDDFYLLTTVASPMNGGDIVGGGTFLEGKNAVLTVTPREGFTFAGWADGSDENPRTYTVTDDVTLTALFDVDDAITEGVTSADSTAAVYQDGTGYGYAIKYQLPYRENGYRVVDVGSGVAWANKNVGVTTEDSTEIGSYFAWGGTEAMENYSTPANPFSENPETLPAANDAATVNMGERWRTPTLDEWTNLLARCDWTGSAAYKVSKKSNANQCIFLPNTGYKQTANKATITAGTANYYWSSTLETWNATYSSCKAYYYTAKKTASATATFGMPVRAVYQPPFTDYVTLTVNAYEGTWQATPTLVGTYYFICERGQRLTLTAYTTRDNYPLQKWTSEAGYTVAVEPIVSLIATEDATYNAYFTTGTPLTTATITTVASPAESGTITGGGTYIAGRTTTLSATPADHYDFTRWSDGNTEPTRTIVATEDKTYTAVFTFDPTGVEAESDPVAVEIYQSGVGEGTYIEYALETDEADDERTYQPVDLGSGVAWANKNIGADTESDGGWYFYWGGTEAVDKTYSTVYFTDVTSMTTTANTTATQHPLPANADAARAVMGDKWRMPTLAEIQNMIDAAPANGAAATGYQHINALNADQQIFIPAAGYKKKDNSATVTGSTTLLWGSTTNKVSAASTQPAYYINSKSNAGTTTYVAWHALPVRAVYVPPFRVCSLTVNIGEHTYYYMCELGQDITITAYATEDGYAFTHWEDSEGLNVSDDITHTFRVTGNATYTAVLTATPDNAYRLITVAQPLGGGDIIGGGMIGAGKTAVLTATPREGFTFTGWSDGSSENRRTVTVTEETTLIAHFSLDNDIAEGVISDDAQATVWMDATDEGTYIRYDLPIENGYRPVDMGAGLAWANKNINAADSTAIGSYFYWGSTTPMETYNASVASEFTFAANDVLAPEYDAATQRIGSHWRTPTSAEWTTLKSTTTWVGKKSSMVYNKLDDEKRIFLPMTGYMSTEDATTISSPLYLYYWTATASSATNACYWRFYYNTSTKKDVKETNNCTFRYGMPVRAVYQPPFEVCTLTVNTYYGEYQDEQTLTGTYTYLCEKGQYLTLTAYPTDPEYALLKWTNADGYTIGVEPVVQFCVNENATYNVYFDSNMPLSTAVISTEADPEIGGTVTGGGNYFTGRTTTLIAVPDKRYAFTQWSDGETDNPRSIVVTEDKTYTAQFAITPATKSAPCSVEVYRTGEDEGTTIRYYLPTDTNGYRPVDMGAGIAWADRNVGAASSDDPGSYFYWGGTTPVTSASTDAFWRGTMAMEVTSATVTAVQKALPAANDAATANIGSLWRMPTYAELYYLVQPTGATRTGSAAEGFTYTNNLDGNELYIPSGGLYAGEDPTTGNTYLWGSTIGTINNGGGGLNQCYTSLPTHLSNASAVLGATNLAWYAMPVRAVYQPSFPTSTITVLLKTGTKTNATYTYVCEYGQQITVSAYPEKEFTAANAYYFVQWTNSAGEVVSTNAMETFTVLGNETYTATFQNTADAYYTVTALASPTTGGSFRGSGPVVKGTTTRLVAMPAENYRFSHWADAPSNTNPERVITVNDDVTYTAIFLPDYDFDNVQSDPAYADVYQSGIYPGTYIRYRLPVENGYRAVDVGSGVAWANKNVGATDSTDVGGYFYWGGTTPVETASISAYYEGVSEMTATTSATAVQYPLPAEADAATVNIGSHWRMPTAAELSLLHSNCTTAVNSGKTCTRTGAAATGYKFVQNEDRSQQLFIPSGGLYDSDGATAVTAGHTFLWGSTVNSINANGYNSLPAFYWNTSYSVGAAVKISNTNYYFRAYYAMPVRAVYEPDHEVRTVTVSVNTSGTSYTNYNFLCELGQTLTVTAHPKNVNTTRVAAWTDPNGVVICTDPTCVFTVLDDVIYKVTFTTAYDDPVTLTTAVTPNETGETSGDGTFEKGQTTLITASPAQYYRFDHWADDTNLTDAHRLVTLNENAAYTAVFAVDANKRGHAIIEQTAAEDIVASIYYRQAGVEDIAAAQKCTLTVSTTNNDITHTNTYICQKGQPVRLQAIPDEGCALAYWSDGETEPVRDFFIEGDMSVTAVFANTTLLLKDKQADAYYDAIAELYYGDGSDPVSLTSLTYNRSFTANQWTVLTLPFTWQLEGTALDGIVFEYTGATGNADEGVYVTFAAASRMDAGVPYLIYPTENIPSLVFTPSGDNPVLQLTDAITNDDDDATAGYADGGTVRFYSTNRRYYLPGSTDPDWKNFIFLSRNRLYYPNEGGNTMHAFRGFFRIDGITGVTPRVRIVVDGETIKELESIGIGDFGEASDDTSVSNVRKFVENGVLIIERNGIRYNAQGTRINNRTRQNN